MRLRDAIALIHDSDVGELGPTTWADLGAGDGTFTLALAELLAAGSTIHAIDTDRAALRRIPPTRQQVRIVTHHGDFTAPSWPASHLDGLLMANSLHYVADQPAFIRMCEGRMRSSRRFLVVEYDSEERNRWVPHPVSVRRLPALFGAAGGTSIRILGSRPSLYRRAPIYAALISFPATVRNGF